MFAHGRFREINPTMHREFLPPATPQGQVEACYRTINAFTQNHVPGVRSSPEVLILRDYEKILGGIATTPSLANDPRIARRVMLTTVALLDATVIDEIIPYHHSGGVGKGTYTRLGGFRTGEGELKLVNGDHEIAYMTNREKERIISEQISTYSTIPVSSVEQLMLAYQQNNQGKFTFTRDITFEEYQEIVARTPAGREINVVLPISLNQNYGLILSSYYRNFGTGVRSELPRQDAWLSFLENGLSVIYPFNQQQVSIPLNQIPENQLMAKFDDVLSRGLGLRGDRHDQRRWRSDRRLSSIEEDDEERVLQWLEQHKSHYREHFGRQSNGFMLTRSGASANEAAILSAHELLDLKNQAFNAHIVGGNAGWYYENQPSLDNLFSLTDNPADASVIFINYNPSTPYFPKPGEQDYESLRDSTIRSLYQRAKQRESTGEKFVLVVDKTSNLLFSVVDTYGPLPSNLTVLETASLTKHQEGGTNYFFGGVWTYGAEDVSGALHDSITDSLGTITPWGIANLPRHTRSSMESMARQAKLNQAALVHGLEQAQRSLPAHARLSLQLWDLYAFIVPDLNLLAKEYLRSNNRSNGMLTGSDTYDFSSYVNQFYLSYRLMETLKSSMGVAEQASFNLNDTTVMGVNSSIPVGNSSISHSMIRLSYGSRATPQQLRLIGKKLGETHADFVRSRRRRP